MKMKGVMVIAVLSLLLWACTPTNIQNATIELNNRTIPVESIQVNGTDVRVQVDPDELGTVLDNLTEQKRLEREAAEAEAQRLLDEEANAQLRYERAKRGDGEDEDGNDFRIARGIGQGFIDRDQDLRPHWFIYKKFNGSECPEHSKPLPGCWELGNWGVGTSRGEIHQRYVGTWQNQTRRRGYTDVEVLRDYNCCVHT